MCSFTTLDKLSASGTHLSGRNAAGEVSFHSGWTFHRADGNSTDQPRRVMTAIYMDKDIRMIEPQHANHRADHERCVSHPCHIPSHLDCELAELYQVHTAAMSSTAWDADLPEFATCTLYLWCPAGIATEQLHASV